MSNRHGDFIWYELMSKDPEAASRFYHEVVGWTVQPPLPDAGMDYRMIDAGDGLVGGVLKLTDEMCDGGARPCWLGYIGVDDVDASVDKVVAAGGKLLMPVRDIPQGRFAILSDPHGATFYVMRGRGEGASTAFKAGAERHFVWNELYAEDLAQALDFYLPIFGWAKGGTMPMGEMGDYQFINQGDEMIGAMMRRDPNGPPPFWGFYVQVPDIDVATDKAKAAGATIMHGPAEIPGGDFIIIGSDPEGATFGLVGKHHT